MVTENVQVRTKVQPSYKDNAETPLSTRWTYSAPPISVNEKNIKKQILCVTIKSIQLFS